MDGSRGDFGGRIGPNALLQLMDVLDRHLGRDLRDMLFAGAGVLPPPPDAGMWPEREVASVHRAVRRVLPGQASDLLAQAGQAVGDYVLAHRIPWPARLLIRALPAPLGARLLTAAITRHAWTFAGSGQFRVLSHDPLTFEIVANPLIAGEEAAGPLCHWHRAVFQRLYHRLIWPRAHVVEVACAAAGAPACRFVISPACGVAAREKGLA
jgi:divinyl protochlorophyllide a 8-vinyl-reductase